jgi:hypothetical protein
MQPEGSFPFSEEPATGPNSEPDESNPHSQTPFLKIYFNTILQFLPYILLVVFFFHVFPPELYTYFSSVPRT